MKRHLAALVVAPLALTTHAAAANTAPTVIIKSATMRGATGLMDVVFRVNDPDDATVKTRALAFIDGERSFAKVIKPTTFAEGTESKLGDTIAPNTDHTLTWNVAADWNISLGQIKFEILAMDTRGLLPLDWVTIPAANGQPELTISKNAPTDQQTLDALFWQYASGDTGMILKDGILRGTPASGVLDGAILANGTYAQFYGPVYALKIMDLAAADERHTDQCAAARIPITDPLRWHALRKPFELFQPGVVWGSEGNISKPMAGLAGIRSIAGDWALTRSGTVIPWGKNGSPHKISIGNIISIAVGGGALITLNSKGQVAALMNPYNQAGEIYDFWGVTAVPESATDVISIAGGFGHCLALKRDGTVVAWGSNAEGQSDFSGFSGIKEISSNGYTNLILRSTGAIQTLGALYNPSTDHGPFVSISQGFYWHIAKDREGNCMFFGDESYFSKPVIAPPNVIPDCSQISASSTHFLALKRDGTVVSYGENAFGQCDVPPGLANVKYIYAGDGFSVALKKAP